MVSSRAGPGRRRRLAALSRPLGNQARTGSSRPYRMDRGKIHAHSPPGMDTAAKLALLSDGDTKCVDLWEGEA